MSRIATVACQQCRAKATVVTRRTGAGFAHQISYDTKAGLLCSIWQKNHPDEDTGGTGDQCRFLRDAKDAAARENLGK